MLEQILQYLRNWFVISKRPGTYTVEDGGLLLPFLRPGQYFRIMGSLFNDGLYRYGDEIELTDETFDGSIWALAVPKALILMAPEIEAWKKEYADALNSPYQSESTPVYSYSMRSGNSSGGGAITWQEQFAARLAPWRKI